MSGESIQRVRIYMNERDTREGMALYIAVLERLRREGATGATALRGMAGFGPGQRIRAGGVGGVADAQPVVIEWVDRVDRIARILPALDDLIDQTLVTVEEVQAYRARLRSSGLFGSKTAGEIMDSTAYAAQQSDRLRDALTQFFARSQQILPIIDDERRLVAVLHTSDLEFRVGIPLPIGVMRALAPEERADVIRAIPDRHLHEFITDEPRTAYVQAAIPQVVATLIEWGLDALPVLDRTGGYIGVVGVDQALAAALMATPDPQAAVKDADQVPAVRLLMQTSVPTIAATSEAQIALRSVLAAPQQYLVLVEEGVPTGLLEAANLLEKLEAPLRYAWLQALRTPSEPHALPGIEAGQAILPMAAPVQVIQELASQNDAIRLLLQGNHERLIVVNEQQQLVGLLAKRALLRSLAQSGG
jgi:PII-like signaling protein/predicted transcriptional regulator